MTDCGASALGRSRYVERASTNSAFAPIVLQKLQLRPRHECRTRRGKERMRLRCKRFMSVPVFIEPHN
jgi:hypothetical protein